MSTTRQFHAAGLAARRGFVLTTGLLAGSAAAQSWDQTLATAEVEPQLANAVAASATVLAVGHPRFDPYNQPQVFDEVRVHELQSGSWVQVAALTSTEPFPSSASFGTALALDGDLLAVGDPGAGGPAGVTGAVHLYRRGAGGWSFEQVVRPESLGQSALEFGAALDLEGGLLAIGGPSSSSAVGTLEDGAVWIFQETAGGFVEQQRIDAPDAELFAHFGRALDLDGGRLLVGNPGASPAGRALLLEDLGAGFAQTAELAPASGATPSGFGSTVALDGTRAAVSAPGANLGNFADGQVHVFEDMGGWVETALLTHPTIRPHDRFGSGLAFEGGSLFATSQNTASALRFDSGPAGWQHAESYVTASGFTWAPNMNGRVASSGAAVFLSDPLGATVFAREVPAELEVNCPGDPHPLSATGFTVLLDVRGELALSEPVLPLLVVADAALGQGVLFYGFGPASKPFGGTTLCVQGPVARAVSSGPPPAGSPFVSLDLDLQSKPVVGGTKAILPGVDAYFQYWFRVPGTGSTFLSNSLRMVFAP